MLSKNIAYKDIPWLDKGLENDSTLRFAIENSPEKEVNIWSYVVSIWGKVFKTPIII